MTLASTSAAPADAPAADEPAPPPPTFDALPLSPELRETLAEIGYVHPTPVQLAVWEPATRGRDAVVQARTGTGKTAAFGIPIVDHIVRRSQAHAQVLALCPTRELALQVSAELERLSKRKGVKVVAVYGGAPMQRQIDALAGGAQVVVGTPGRVLDHLRRGTLIAKHIRLLVLDECDEMLSMGFERELNAILAELPPERQTVLFSATLPPDIERMARSKLRSPEFVTLSGDAVGALEVQHFVYLITGDKPGSLIRILEVDDPESAIIFCNTRDETETVAAALRRQGYDADWLNGDLPQSDREKVMSATREGRLRFLVATDVAARGIDISHLTHVINYDFPQDAEGYVHRTGRTGRAGRTGTAISLITPKDVGPLYILRLTYKIRPLEKQLPSEGELKTRAEADLVTMLAEAFLPKGTHPDDLSLARRLLTHDHAERLVAGLLRDHLGARPTAQEEASAARRAQPPQRAPSPEPAKATPAAEPQAAASAGGHRAPRLREARRASDQGGHERGAPTGVDTAIRERSDRPTREAQPPAPAPEGRAPEGADARSPETERSKERAQAREREAGRERDGDRGRRPLRPRREEGRRPPRSAEGGEEARRPAGEGKAREDAPASAEPLTRPEPPMRVEPPRAEAADREEPRAASSSAPPAPRAAPVEADRARERAAATFPAPRARRAGPQPPMTRHADFTMWQPPEEEGDDEPILGELPASAARAVEPAAAVSPQCDDAARGETQREERDGDFVEIYVNVGRRDGARASDIQRVLVERAEVDRADIRRIRVRDRNAFVSVPRANLDRVISALNGATIAGREAHAEQARERAAATGESAED